jgi:hypothetical protein
VHDQGDGERQANGLRQHSRDIPLGARKEQPDDVEENGADGTGEDRVFPVYFHCIIFGLGCVFWFRWRSLLGLAAKAEVVVEIEILEERAHIRAHRIERL